MLGGLAFAALYSTLAIPLALLADRTSRTWVITVSLGVWSGFTALCGFAQNFTQMFLFRLGVGVGEAGGVAPSYALIGDYFPPEKRARALSIYSLGIPVGAAGGVARRLYRAECRVADGVHRRRAAGLLIAPLFRLVVRDRRAPPPRRNQVPLSARLRHPRRQAELLAARVRCGGGIDVRIWRRLLAAEPDHAQLRPRPRADRPVLRRALLLTGGVAGILLGGWLGDRLGARNRRWYALAPAICYVAGTPLFIAGVLSGSWQAAFAVVPAAPGAGLCLARPGAHRGPAPRPRAYARHRLGELPADQQSDRAGAGELGDRRAVDHAEAELWRRSAALCRSPRAVPVSGGGVLMALASRQRDWVACLCAFRVGVIPD
jgi:hypothetical protein